MTPAHITRTSQTAARRAKRAKRKRPLWPEQANFTHGAVEVRAANLIDRDVETLDEVVTLPGKRVRVHLEYISDAQVWLRIGEVAINLWTSGAHIYGRAERDGPVRKRLAAQAAARRGKGSR